MNPDIKVECRGQQHKHSRFRRHRRHLSPDRHRCCPLEKMEPANGASGQIRTGMQFESRDRRTPKTEVWMAIGAKFSIADMIRQLGIERRGWWVLSERGCGCRKNSDDLTVCL